MSATDNTPLNKNFLSPLDFNFKIKKTPHVNFWVQKVNIPSITLPSPIVANPLVRVPYHGEHLLFGDLTVTFKVDEDLQNYLELYKWIRALGPLETREEFKQIQDVPQTSGDGILSDVSLTVLSSTKMPNYEIVYVDAFPTFLGEITFNTTEKTINYIEATAVFKYNYFTIHNI